MNDRTSEIKKARKQEKKVITQKEIVKQSRKQKKKMEQGF